MPSYALSIRKLLRSNGCQDIGPSQHACLSLGERWLPQADGEGKTHTDVIANQCAYWCGNPPRLLGDDMGLDAIMVRLRRAAAGGAHPRRI